MSPVSLRATLTDDSLVALDEAEVIQYNRRARDSFRLRLEMGPSAFEGDIDSAPVILLLSNPGFDETSTLDDHRFQRDGWPLSGLHPEAPPGLRKWWMTRLGPLVTEFGARRVSQRVACIQVTPWASANFDSGLRLPSRQLLLDAADHCAARGSVMIVMRAESLWLEAEQLHASPKRFRVNAWRCSYVSPGNLPADCWERVVQAVGDG